VSNYVVIDGIGGRYRRRLCDFLRTRPRRRKNHTYCVKCSLSRATAAPPVTTSSNSLPRRSVGFSPPRIARPRLPSLALRTLSEVDWSGKQIFPWLRWLMDHDRRWRVAERYHVLFLRTSFLDLVLVCGGRLSADFESHFSQNIFVAYSRNPVKGQ